LFRSYPRPDLVICLDAPAALLFERKPEGTLEDRERRRREYLELGRNTPGFRLVRADQPQERVIQDVIEAITAYERGPR